MPYDRSGPVRRWRHCQSVAEAELIRHEVTLRVALVSQITIYRTIGNLQLLRSVEREVQCHVGRRFTNLVEELIMRRIDNYLIF